MLFLNVALILIFLSAVGIYYFESGSQPEHFASVFHSLWWAIVTLTTVGYGDVFPITIGGRVFLCPFRCSSGARTYDGTDRRNVPSYEPFLVDGFVDRALALQRHSIVVDVKLDVVLCQNSALLK